MKKKKKKKTKKSSLKTVKHHREGIYTSFKVYCQFLPRWSSGQWRKLIVVADFDSPGSNPLK